MDQSAIVIYEEDLNTLLLIHRLVRSITHPTYKLFLTAIPEEALDYVQTYPVALAIVEYAPGVQGRMDGLHLLQAMSDNAPATDILVTSIFMTQQLEQACLRAGAHACLAKPFPLERLEALVVQRLLERRR